MIHIYDIGNENFEGNGNAILTPISCSHKQVAGGGYDIELVHAIDEGGKWEHIVPGAIVRAPVPKEVIENAFAGYAADIYKTTVEAALREGPTEPTSIVYPTWSITTDYRVGAKVSWQGKAYQCTYYDETSAWAHIAPPSCNWWKQIPNSTPGDAALATLPAGTELYLIESYDATWYKMSTYYGLEGYIKKSQVTFYKHLTPEEVQPRIITEQLFRLREPTIDNEANTVTVTGMHVSYDLSGILVQNVNLSQVTPAMAIGRIVEEFMMEYRGTIATNITDTTAGTYTGTIKGKNGMFALLDPDKGVVAQFDAKFTRDNWDLFIMKKTTADRGFRIRYGVNMRGVNWKKSSSSLITRIVPVAKDEKGEPLYLPEKWVDSSHINDYPVINMEQITVSGQVGKDKGKGDDSTWTEADLLDEMRAKAGERFTVEHVDEITEEVTIQFEQLGDTYEYRQLKDMETVLLYDTVKAYDERIGLEKTLYVAELEYDCVRKRVTGVKLSNKLSNVKANITGYNVQNNSITPAKLTDEVAQSIVDEVQGIIPEYSDQTGSSGSRMNSKTENGFVKKGQGQANKFWGTDADGNPDWRTTGGGGTVPINSRTDDGLVKKGQGNANMVWATDANGDPDWRAGGGSVTVNDNDPTLSWGTRSKVGTVAGTDLHVTMPAQPSVTVQVVDSNPTLAWGQQSQVGTVNGSALHVTMPADPVTPSALATLTGSNYWNIGKNNSFLAKAGNIAVMKFSSSASDTAYPAGGFTQIGSVPAGFYPKYEPVMSIHDVNGKNFALRITTSGKIEVYNYYNAATIGAFTIMIPYIAA